MSIATSTLSAQIALLRLMLLVEGSAKLHLSEEPWQDYSVFDYDSSKNYCQICLLNENDPANPTPKSSLCYLPIIAPNGDGVNLNALLAAQKTLLDADSLEFPVGEGKHQRAAQNLVEVMKRHELKPKPALLKLAKLEESEL